MEIYFDFAGEPVGGKIINYLLEKSRIVRPSPGERSFHIFYQVIVGSPDSEKKQLSVDRPDSFAYLRSSDCYKVDNMDDVQEFRLTLEGMGTPWA